MVTNENPQEGKRGPREMKGAAISSRCATVFSGAEIDALIAELERKP
jgi:hypothetical protein